MVASEIRVPCWGPYSKGILLFGVSFRRSPAFVKKKIVHSKLGHQGMEPGRQGCRGASSFSSSFSCPSSSSCPLTSLKGYIGDIWYPIPPFPAKQW